MGIKIGFTGTQRGMTKAQQKAFGSLVFDKLSQEPEPNEFHHGDCIGADSDAHDVMIGICHVTIHPPFVSGKRAFKKGDFYRIPMEYLERNRNIVNATDILIATPSEKQEQQRSGTWSTVRYARKANKPIYIIFPDGSMKVEAAQMELLTS